MNIPIHYCDGTSMKYLGYIEAESFSQERCYNLCNWSNRRLGKHPPELFSDVCRITRGVCFTNPQTNEVWLPLSFGWLHGSEEDIMTYVQENTGRLLWVGGNYEIGSV